MYLSVIFGAADIYVADRSGGIGPFNVSSSTKIQRTDIFYFTTGDIIDGIKLLVIIAVLVLIIAVLMKLEKKLP